MAIVASIAAMCTATASQGQTPVMAVSAQAREAQHDDVAAGAAS